MASLPEFARRQYAFAANIRDPECHPAPEDIEDRRMQIYRELFYNNVEGFLSGTFPVLRRIYSDADWHTLVREYFSRHRSRTPLFHEIPREFLNWLENGHAGTPADPPFLCELAHYEWVELALSIADAPADTRQVDPEGDLLNGIPVLSPYAWHLAYRYPVHRIGPDYLPQRPGDTPTWLVVYRDRDEEVGFLEINSVTRRLLELIDADAHRTGKELLTCIATEMSHPQPEVVLRGGTEIMQNLRQKQILTGTLRA
ncbi:MAG TPA: putative DNA-binding domain-containing protein [Gammaproteobacteria bacterium]|nr:putative DNA-binding domain-containing protein [Gammaproteobacteria bacterium]